MQRSLHSRTALLCVPMLRSRTGDWTEGLVPKCYGISSRDNYLRMNQRYLSRVQVLILGDIMVNRYNIGFMIGFPYL